MKIAKISRFFLFSLTTVFVTNCGAGSAVNGQNACLAQTRYVFGGVSDQATSSSSECISDAADGDSIANLPTSPSPLDHLFLGANVQDASEIDALNLENGPEAYQLSLTGTDNFAALSSRSKVTSFLSKCQDAGAVPIITLATLFNRAYTTESQFVYRLTQEANIHYFFSQLTALLDLTDATESKVTILLEPRLFESFLNSYGESGLPSQITVPTYLIYDASYLDKTVDPTFENTLPGFIAATNYYFLKTRSDQQSMAWQIGLNAASAIPFLDDFRSDMSETNRSATIHQKAITWAGLTDALGYHSYGLNLLGFKLEGDASYHCATQISLTACKPAMNAKDWENLTDFLWELHNESDFSFLLNGVSFGHLEGTLTSTAAYDMAGTYLFGGNFTITDAYFSRYTEHSTAVGANYTYAGDGIAALYDAFVVGILFGDAEAQDIDYTNDAGWWLTQVQSFAGDSYPVD